MPWWQEFDIYLKTRNRRLYIGIGKRPEKPQKIYECPLREAKCYQKILDDPFINSLADVARELGITRARVSQVMGLLKLAPEIQKELLNLQDQKAIRYFSERRLRPLLTIKDQARQIREFKKMRNEFQLG